MKHLTNLLLFPNPKLLSVYMSQLDVTVELTVVVQLDEIFEEITLPALMRKVRSIVQNCMQS